MCQLSIVVPCFNEEDNICIFFDEILRNVAINDFEIVFIDDGSKDNTLERIKQLAKRDSRVKYVSFSRNFGKESALYCGLMKSEGELICIMDADMQDPPFLLPEMLEILQQGEYDIVATRRVSRKGEPIIKSFFARMFYRLINRISNLDLVDGARDYRLMTRPVCDAILQLEEYNRFSKGLFNWIGFKTKWIEYENIERNSGESSWSFWKLVEYSINGIVAFTTLPLSISTIFGVLFSIIAFVLMIIIAVRTFLFSDPVQGWTSLICVILILGAIQLFTIGILGKYLEKTYLETKNRPIFIINETNMG